MLPASKSTLEENGHEGRFQIKPRTFLKNAGVCSEKNRKAGIKSLMNVSERKEVCQDRAK